MSSTHEHIKNYIDYLVREHSLFVTIHSRGDRYPPICVRYADFNMHVNRFCLYIKTDSEIWKKCVLSQQKVCDRCSEGSWLGMCHAGVVEYVYPILTEGKPADFVSVSGYRPAEDSVLYPKAMHKLSKLCREFGLAPEDVRKVYEAHLTTDIPDKKKVDTLIEPLCDMIRLEYLETRESSDRRGGRPGRDDLYYHICNSIRNMHDHKISLEGICAQTHYSASYISHLFKSRSGMTINQYVNALRIDEARAMLDSTDMSIQDIGLTVGFSDANYFSNVFRASVGVSPREYRNRFRKSDNGKDPE